MLGGEIRQALVKWQEQFQKLKIIQTQGSDKLEEDGNAKMKYIIILYMCSMTTGQCPSSQISAYEFDNHVDCVLEGYKVSHNTFMNLQTIDDFQRERIEKEKIVIKFECKQLGEV